jgi:hypothetical protein
MRRGWLTSGDRVVSPVFQEVKCVIEVMLLFLVFVVGIGGMAAGIGMIAWRLLKKKAE